MNKEVSLFWRLRGMVLALGRVVNVRVGSMCEMRGDIMSQEAERRNNQSPRVSFRARSQYQGSWHKVPPVKVQHISGSHHPGASLCRRASA